MNSSASTSTQSEQFSPELTEAISSAKALEAKRASEAVESPTIGPDGNIVEPPPPVDYQGEAKLLVNFVADSLIVFYPSTAEVLTEEKRTGLSFALAPVMEKYGLTMGEVFGKWGAEINLIWSIMTIAMPLANAIRADRAAAAEAKAAETGHPAPTQRGTMAPVVERTDPTSLHTKA